MPSDTSEDEWITAYYEGSEVDSVECDTLIDPQPISVDGHPGSIAVNDACADAQAFVFVEGRVHVFAVWRADQEALLEAFLSTVEFQE